MTATYEFECNMSNEFKDYKDYDEWGCAFVWLENVGTEYNFCFDSGESCCAIYKTKMNEETGYMETDYNEFVHYDIDFNNENWEKELENAMYNALIKFHNL